MILCATAGFSFRCSEITGEERSGMILCATAGFSFRCSEFTEEERSWMILSDRVGVSCVAAVRLLVLVSRSSVYTRSVLLL
jgi:hypothetical protein